MEHAEAFETLRTMAERGFGRIDAAMLARQVLSVTEGGDWPLREACMEALKRRQGFARRDGLRVAERPGACAFGCYTTRRKGSAARPYRTQLHSISPLSASCDCPDYRQAGLGLCKHVLAVLADLYERPRKLEAALARGAIAGPERALRWDPVRALLGEGDWLLQVRLHVGARGPTQSLSRYFAPPTADGLRAPKPAVVADPRRRRSLVDGLHALTGAGGAIRRVKSCSVDAALRPLLVEERARLDRAHVPSRGELTRALRSLKQTLYPYQRQGVERFLSERSLLLADDMGLGKTAQAIAGCHALHRLGRVTRGLLIVPAALKPQWLREWHRFSDAPIEIVEGGPAERSARYGRTRRGFLIVNYEQLLRDLPQIQAFDPQLVVLDEAQRIKNWATKTASCVKRLSPTYRLVLTGTPMENRLEELASIMQWIDRRALEPAWRLQPWHCTDDGARHLETLRVRLRPRMLRRVRREVLDQLPPRTDTAIPVEFTEAQRETHADLDRPIARLAHTAKRRPLTQAEFMRLMALLLRQRLICNGLALSSFEEMWPQLRHARPGNAVLRGLFSPKLVELRALVQSLVVEQGRRVVIFSQWRRMLQLAEWVCRDVLDAAGLRAVYFTGGESPRRRTQNIVDFHDDQATRVLFASDAGGVGLNLQRAASCCINLELPWNPAVLEQRIGRIYRLGQTVPVEVYNLISEAGIEARIASLVADKRALFEGLFDGDSDTLTFDEQGAFMDRVGALLSPVNEPQPAHRDEDDDDEVADEIADEIAADALGRGPSALDRQNSGLSQPAPPPTAPSMEDAALAPGPTLATLSDLGRQLDVHVAPDGTVQLSAPPEAAASLADLLQGLAAQLRQPRPR